ncbi:RRXRR domain-containing protein [Nonomuraea sp. 3N208]|uniref:RRXRR domain-containing protein n=1 Tax=Nonomuraea sp. 3N208 TaxID=3457421 RepID=UPI003FCD379A
MFVLDRNGQPLQPTRPAMARKLLASGRAVVHHHTPLVIRLKDRDASTCRVPGVETSIDPGSQHTGIAVFCTGGGIRTGLFALQLDHRGARIRDRLARRACYRRRRRSANLRYRAPRRAGRLRRDLLRGGPGQGMRAARRRPAWAGVRPQASRTRSAPP